MRGILEIFAAKTLRCGLCAPTGRAAKRLTETTGREAKTIHRLLEFDPALGGFKRNARQPARPRSARRRRSVDGGRGADESICCRRCRRAACLVLVGDVDQLPSVGPGTVLADIIASERGAGGAADARSFARPARAGSSAPPIAVHQGEMPESAPPGQGDFYFIEAPTPEAVTDRIITMVRDAHSQGVRPRSVSRRAGADADEPQRPRRRGAEPLLAGSPEPAAQDGAEVERFGWKFRVGDKVMQTRNNYDKEVFNGDVGRIAAIDETSAS